MKPWLKQQWCLPSPPDAAFVCQMEEVLEVYTRPYDARRPLLCMDEGGKQLVRAVRQPEPMQPGQPQREDYEYERVGCCRIFVASEPLGGQRVMQVRERRTKADWAHCMRDVMEVYYPTAEKVVVVMDNLNTHHPASFYEVFPPEEAGRLRNKLELHSTPKHGSWLNMAEIELSVLARQALADRLSTLDQVQERVAAWQARRNQQHLGVQWRFTTADARIKLKRLYPSFED